MSETGSFKCSCGADVSSQMISDTPGSKSGHVIYHHVPGPPCKDFMAKIQEVTKKHGGKIVQRP